MMSETYSDLISKYKKLKKQYLSHKNLQPIKVAILSGSTIGHIKLLLELALLKEGISPEFHEGQYNNYYEEGAFDNPSLKAFNPDYVYIHTTSRNIDFNDTNVIYDRLTQVWDNISNKYGAVIIQNNFEPLPYRLLGNSDVYYNKGRHYAINALNERLYSHARNNTNFYINDINYICAMYGGEKWWNDDIWYAFKYALDLDAVPLLCANITKIIKSVMGFNKKALILDLDNTLWGGIIGEDGIDGIQLGDETPEGMAYRDLQNYLKDLSNIGVMLNVVSKNEDVIARKGFEHFSSVLKADDFISFKANWEPKHKNIIDMAKELNIGLDSMVFIDDTPAEQDIVKHYIPEVSVPHINDPINTIRIIDQHGFFEKTSLSEEDQLRNKYYQQNNQRENSIKTYSDIKDYLKSLEMKCIVDSFNQVNAERVTQLINKTNQFNLTTKRYSSIVDLIPDREYITLCARLLDKFGDNGIVTALIAGVKDNIAIIDLWVMSCRVFKRDLEFVFFDKFVDKCKEFGIITVKGYYVPSGKNTIVSALYTNLGFQRTHDTDGNEIFTLDIAKYKPSGISYIHVG